MNYLFALYLSKDIDRIRQRKKYIESLNDKKIKVEVNKTIKNNYQEIFILDQEYIDEILKNIFDINFRSFISNQTKSKYSIDFILLYKNKYIQ